jgi:hypothetical protein
MARGRNPRIYIEGDADGVKRASREAETAVARLSHAGTRAFGGMRAAALAAGVAFTALTAGVAKFGVSAVRAAQEAEASNAKVRRMVDTAGVAWDKYGEKIDKAIQAQSRRFKMDDEALAESFGNMLRTTGDVNKALALNVTAVDIARAKNIQLADAQSMLARVYNGSFLSLRKLGIQFEPVTKAQDKLKESGRAYTEQQLEQAKAADKVASREAALAAIRQKFAGQGDAYAQTTKGKIEGFQVAWENLQETIGARLLPAVGDAFDAMAGGIKTVTDEWPKIERAIAPVIEAFGSKLGAAVAGFSNAARRAFPVVADIIGQVRAPIAATVANLSRLWGALAEDGARAFRRLAPVVGPLMREILKTVQSVIALITAVWVRWGDEITTVVVTALRAVAAVMRPALQVIRGVLGAVTAVIDGDWSKAWGGMTTVVRGAINLVLAMLRAVPARMAGAAVAIGTSLISKIGSGLRQLPATLAAIIGAAIRAIPGLIADAAINAGKALGRQFADGLRSVAGGLAGALNPFSSGGFIGGPGPRDVDSRLVLARPDEVILTPQQQRLVESGVSITHALAMTGGKVQRFSTGGWVDAAYRFARAQVGKGYTPGGTGQGQRTGPNFWDCSGFATYVAAQVPGFRGTKGGTTFSEFPISKPARGDEPIVYGFRSWGRSRFGTGYQHMGIRVKGVWFDAGSGGVEVGDSRWDVLRVPAGLERLRGTGDPASDVDPTPATGNRTVAEQRDMAADRRNLAAALRVGRALLRFRPSTPWSASDAITARHRDDSLQDKQVGAAAEQAARGAGITNPDKLDAIRQQAVRAARIRELQADRRDLIAERGRHNRTITGLKRARKAAFASLRKTRGAENRRRVLDRIRDLNRQLQDAWDARTAVDREIADVDAQLAELGWDQAQAAQEITSLPDNPTAAAETTPTETTPTDTGVVNQPAELTAEQRARINTGILAEEFIRTAFGPGDIGVGGRNAITAATGGRFVTIRVDASSFARAVGASVDGQASTPATLVPSGA